MFIQLLGKRQVVFTEQRCLPACNLSGHAVHFPILAPVLAHTCKGFQMLRSFPVNLDYLLMCWKCVTAQEFCMFTKHQCDSVSLQELSLFSVRASLSDSWICRSVNIPGFQNYGRCRAKENEHVL